MTGKTWEMLWQDSDQREPWTTPDPNVVNMLPRLREVGVRRVLDLGCGIGRHVRLLAKEGLDVHGLDVSPSAVEFCQTWLAKEELEATVLTGDMTTIPYPDGHFDFVLSWNVIYHGTRAQTRGAIEEIRRATREDGLTCLTFISTRNRNFGKGTEVEPNTFDNPAKGDGGLLHHYVDETEVRELLRGWHIETMKEEEQIFRGEVVPNSWHWVVTATRGGL